ncbi:hypothetical protein RFI_23538, partial [Reticulomyxa filosa]
IKKSNISQNIDKFFSAEKSIGNLKKSFAFSFDFIQKNLTAPFWDLFLHMSKTTTAALDLDFFAILVSDRKKVCRDEDCTKIWIQLKILTEERLDNLKRCFPSYQLDDIVDHIRYGRWDKIEEFNIKVAEEVKEIPLDILF